MPRFETRSTLPRPPAIVFAHILDLSQWPSFRGFGPLPGIVRAALAGPGPLGLGARIRVTNTDGSVHHEVVEELVPGERYRVCMELTPPASWLMARIDEIVTLSPAPVGTEIRRCFEVVPRSPLTTPLCWLIAKLLRRAVEAHNRAVAKALA